MYACLGACMHAYVHMCMRKCMHEYVHVCMHDFDKLIASISLDYIKLLAHSVSTERVVKRFFWVTIAFP